MWNLVIRGSSGDQTQTKSQYVAFLKIRIRFLQNLWQKKAPAGRFNVTPPLVGVSESDRFSAIANYPMEP